MYTCVHTEKCEHKFKGLQIFYVCSVKFTAGNKKVCVLSWDYSFILFDPSINIRVSLCKVSFHLAWDRFRYSSLRDLSAITFFWWNETEWKSFPFSIISNPQREVFAIDHAMEIGVKGNTPHIAKDVIESLELATSTLGQISVLSWFTLRWSCSCIIYSHYSLTHCTLGSCLV